MISNGPPSDDASRPNRVPWPPILLFISIATGWALGLAVPLPVGAPAARLLGYVMIAAGVLLDLWAVLTRRQAHTNILPHRGTDVLVIRGPFRFTRNPIYLGNSIATAALALIVSNLWYFLLALVVAILVDRLAIRREERHLTNRFGRRYQDYAHTPRWLLR